MLGEFRSNPNDTYLVRVGYGGMNGPLTNVDRDGCASASFHSWPETLAWDYYTGDYGPNFVGLMLGSATYIIEDAELGLEVFGGNLVPAATANCGGNNGNTIVAVQPRDAVRRRVFIGPLGLNISIDAGVIEEICWETSGGGSNALVDLSISAGGLSPGEPTAESAILWLETTTTAEGNYTVSTDGLSVERLGWKIPLQSQQSTSVKIGRA
jgi:hypothetical protein